MNNPPITPPQQAPHERITNMSTPTSKPLGSSVAFDTSSNLLHVRASGHKTRPEELYTEDDEFVQDLHQQHDSGRMEESVEEPSNPNEFDYLDGDSVYEDAEEPDLFSKSFPNVKEEEEEGDDGDEIDIIDRPNQSKTSAKSKSKQPTNGYDHHDATEHASGCNNNARSASTPPPPSTTTTSSRNNKTNPNMPPTQKKPEEADFGKDLRRSLTQQRKLHDKAKLFTPRLPLDAHRYWVCVLHEGRKVSTITSEKHFTWMKANRFTTIATIWHTHATVTLSNGFVLLLGHERVDFKDCLGELDYFHERFVCLRAVGEGSEQAKGKELGEGCPPEVGEVIELD
ncbi:hypothetical protein LTR56_005015 [Elasticomyces elasticus]|nr:hypothetical protein LTR22_022324 [Elasticomyces elasticus]KAK3652721.1 hypothetical protein LTR56_005015 [Elasticomyces elasticus]KAK4908372.1 hypothetical protein LTR49_022730 [Elasticomyces elasticus]KAK5748412.1 hypothetical protein LTS12_021540 [Elasticomyces elasticus]